METKKILIILSAVLLALILLILASMYFLQTNPTPTATIEPTGTTPPIVKNNKVIPLSLEPIMAPYLDKQAGTIKYFSKSSGNLYSVKFTGQSNEVISSAKLPSIISAVWSLDGQKVIGTFEGDSKNQSYLYDYETGQSTTLDKNISKIAFSPTEDRIAYLFYDSKTEKGNIATADPNTANWKNLFPTIITDWQITWPAKNLVSILTAPSGLAQGIVYAINTLTGQYQNVISDQFGLMVKWSPDGAKILYSTTDEQGKNLKLYIAAKDGSNKKLLPFATLADKCIFSLDGRTIFCATMQNIPKATILPDDYLKSKYRSADEFIEYNIEKDETTKLLSLNESDYLFDASGLILSPEEDYLFFVNRRDGRLYSLKLQ